MNWREPTASLLTRNVPDAPAQANLFRHVSAEKAALYRSIMATFAAAKRQFRLHLRPDEVLEESEWEGAGPQLDEVQAALAQLVAWGNLEAQPDMARTTNLADFYRIRSLYRLSRGGEAVETALLTFARALAHRAELQSVALEDIAAQLENLQVLASAPVIDAVKAHATLRDLVRVFENLTENAQAFMADVNRKTELQQARADAVQAYKKRLIEYLERFIGDLVGRSGGIAARIRALSPRIDTLLAQVAAREARDSAPGDEAEQLDATARATASWRERWNGLQRWFVGYAHEPPQSEVLRSKARSAIPQLLQAINTLNERRAGRSDRSADFRTLALWFADCADDAGAHRLARAAFALNPARHFSLDLALQAGGAHDLPASTPWAAAPPLTIHPRLREYGEASPRGTLPRVRARDEERRLLALRLHEEQALFEAARERLATGVPTRLSELGPLDAPTFGLFLSLLAEAIGAQGGPDESVAFQSGDGLLAVQLRPLGASSRARIATSAGTFSGRDHEITITRT